MTSVPTTALHAEAVHVARKRRDTGSVPVSIATEAQDHRVDEMLTSVRVKARHIPVDRMVDQVPPSPHEGDTLIIPVAEEVIVTRFLIAKETRLSRTVTTRPHQDASVRAERAIVTRSSADGSPPLPNVQQDPEEQDNGQ